jgi:transcriptional regulator with XRE-family HTH domain
MAKKRTPISEQVRQAVRDCGLTRYEIAKRTGISNATLSRFIHGERGLSMEYLDTLGELLGLEIVVRHKPAKQRATQAKKGG